MKKHMAEAIYELVKNRRHVSFVELERMIPGFKKEMPDGRVEVFTYNLPQLVIWINLSDEAFEALNELLRAKKVFLNPCSILVYHADGGMLNLPIPRRKPRADSKKDYWIPCVVDVEPKTRKSK